MLEREGEGAFGNVFVSKVVSLPLWVSGVSVSEPRSAAGQDREVGAASITWETENGSSSGPTLSVCSKGTLIYTFKSLCCCYCT